MDGQSFISTPPTALTSWIPFPFHSTTIATLNTGLSVIIGVVIVALLYIQFITCDELLGALTLANIALLTVGAAGFIGTIAYYQATLNQPDIKAATTIYVIFALTALFVPQFFVGCGGSKRQLVIAVASLASGIAAVDFGRAVAFSRAIAFDGHNVNNIDFSPLAYIASAVGAVFLGQAIVWIMFQANIYTALIASAIGLIADGIALQVIFFVNRIDISSVFSSP